MRDTWRLSERNMYKGARQFRVIESCVQYVLKIDTIDARPFVVQKLLEARHTVRWRVLIVVSDLLLQWQLLTPCRACTQSMYILISYD